MAAHALERLAGRGDAVVLGFSQTLTVVAVATASEPSPHIRSESAERTPNSAQTSTSPAPTRSAAYREDGSFSMAKAGYCG